MLADCLHPIDTTQGLMLGLAAAGLVGGFTHCVGMCGPFVMSMTRPDSPETLTEKLRGAALIPYHLGRMTTYVALAGIFHSALNVAFLFAPIKSFLIAPLLFLAGVMFLAHALPHVMSLVPWVGRVRVGIPLRYLTRFITPLTQSPHPLSRYLLGVVLGFMPCGLVVSAIMAASMAPNLTDALVAMSLFTFGTVPALFAVALGGHGLRNKFPSAFPKFQGGLMALSGLWLCALAGLMIF